MRISEAASDAEDLPWPTRIEAIHVQASIFEGIALHLQGGRALPEKSSSTSIPKAFEAAGLHCENLRGQPLEELTCNLTTT